MKKIHHLILTLATVTLLNGCTTSQSPNRAASAALGNFIAQGETGQNQ